MIGRPHFFIHGNLVFASGPDDAWAGYRLEGRSYPGLSVNRKLELKSQLESFAYAIEELRAAHRRKRSLMKLLDGLEGG